MTNGLFGRRAGRISHVGAAAQAHHAVASAYDLNKEIVLEGELLKLNFVNPHSNLHLGVKNPTARSRVGSDHA